MNPDFPWSGWKMLGATPGQTVCAGSDLVYRPCNYSTPQVYPAIDSATLASALASAAAYTSSTGQPSTVQLGPGSYNLTTQFSEPMVNGSGVSIVGVPGATNVFMSTRNGGAPWGAMIFRGSSAGNKGQFILSGLSLTCTDAGSTAINALYGLQLQEVRGTNMIIRDVQVNNCGSAALGGENIAIGGAPNTDSLGLFMSNVSTNYNEGFYTGPAGGSGPTPPDNGIHFLSGVADSHFLDLQVRNGMKCGIRVDSGGANGGTGGLYFVRPHAFGFANTNPQNYFQQYSFCDYDNSGVDHWINAYADSPLAGGFLLQTPAAGVEIVSPFFYWPGSNTLYPNSNMMTIGATATNVTVANPVCYQRPYSNAAGNLTNQSGATPVIYGGAGCGVFDSANYFNTETPINVGVDVSGYGLIVGSGANATNKISVSGGRFQIGYYQPTGISILQAGSGKPFGFYAGSSFATGFIGVLSPSTGLGIGGASYLTPNFVADLSGVVGQVANTNMASAATIAPAAAVTEITGTATITTITPLAPICTTNATACRITLHSVAGFSLGTGGNIAAAVTVPAGRFVDLVYLQNLAQWSVGL